MRLRESAVGNTASMSKRRIAAGATLIALLDLSGLDLAVDVIRAVRRRGRGRRSN